MDRSAGIHLSFVLVLIVLCTQCMVRALPLGEIGSGDNASFVPPSNTTATPTPVATASLPPPETLRTLYTGRITSKAAGLYLVARGDELGTGSSQDASTFELVGNKVNRKTLLRLTSDPTRYVYISHSGTIGVGFPLADSYMEYKQIRIRRGQFKLEAVNSDGRACYIGFDSKGHPLSDACQTPASSIQVELHLTQVK